jgi:Flp pilus assembly protein TadG
MANAYYTGMTRRISWQSLHAILTDTDGAALIEITLFVPFLALTSVAIINFGLYFWYQTEVVNAA